MLYRYQMRINFDAESPDGGHKKLHELFREVHRLSTKLGLDLNANASCDPHNVNACRECHDNAKHAEDGELSTDHDVHQIVSFYCPDCRWETFAAKPTDPIVKPTGVVIIR